MKNSKRKNRILLFLVLILGISIGFAALSTTLKIDGSTIFKKNIWSIYWDEDSIEVTEGSKGNTIPDVTNGIDGSINTKLTWNVNLELPGDFYEFTIDAVNSGTLDAMITDINDEVSPTLPDYIRYSVTYDDGTTPSNKDLFPKKDGSTLTKQKYKVRVEVLDTMTRDDVADIPEGGVLYTFNYEVQYGQADSSAVDPNSVIVSLDLDGGTITETDGWTISGNTATKYVKPNSPYGTIPTPTKEGYTFAGWITNDSSSSSSYEQLEYIESDGTQYIDLRYIPNVNTKLELDLLLSGPYKSCEVYDCENNGGSNILFGTIDSNGQWFIANFGDLSSQYNELFIWPGDGSADGKQSIILYDGTMRNRNTLVLENGSFTYGEQTRTLNAKTANNLTTMYLFGANAKEYDYNGPFTVYNMRVYGLKIYENSVLVKNYVPAMNKISHDIGLYDKVEEEFYGNIGTGVFLTPYVDSTTIVTKTSNHTLTAIWKQN